MAFHPTFHPLNFEQANPLITGLLKGQDIYSNLQDQERRRIENKFRPMTLGSEAASKLAYANLMGPQFLAKLMGNTDILANMPESKRIQALDLVTNAGMGQGAGSSFLNPFVQQYLQNSSENVNPFSEQKDKFLKNYNGYIYDKKGNNIVATPEEIQEAIKRSSPIESNYISEEKTFPEKASEYRKIQAQGSASGKNIASDIQDFGRQYDAGLRLNDKFNTLTELINNDEFRQMRSDIPFFQDKQLRLLSKIGTPYQQEMIGRLKNTSEEIIRDTINSFTGRILKGELDISRNMKISDDDTFNTIVGKVHSASVYKDLNMKRISIASDLMENQHISKKKALEIANKMTDAQEVINNINKKLDYKIQIKNKKTGAIETIPVSEARKRGIPNV